MPRAVGISSLSASRWALAASSPPKTPMYNRTPFCKCASLGFRLLPSRSGCGLVLPSSCNPHFFLIHCINCSCCVMATTLSTGAVLMGLSFMKTQLIFLIETI